MDGLALLATIDVYDKAMDNAEAATVKRVNQRLTQALGNIRDDLTTYYESLEQQGSLAAQMQVRRSEELSALLGQIDPEYDSYYQDEFTALLETANQTGTLLGDELLASYGANSLVGSFTTIPYAAIANQASQGLVRLSRHTATFRDTASGVIELGLIQGKGAKWMQKQLEKSLDITKKKAEDIARTETSSALNAAAEQRYAAAGITKVQLLITPSQNVCPYCAARNGAVFDLGKLKVPLHVRCRCLLVPYDDAWAKAGLVDEKFIIGYHNKGIAELRKNGLEPDYTGAAPFERANKLPIPKTAWTPRGKDAAAAREFKPTATTKTTKPAKEKTTRKPRKATAAKVKEIKTATKAQRDLPPVVTMTNPKTPSEMATLGRQTYAKEYQAIQSVKPVSSALKAAEAKALDKVMANPADLSAMENYKTAAQAYRNDRIRYDRDRISAFSDLREKMKSRGDRLSAQAWADSIEIDEGVEKLYGSNRIRGLLTDFHLISRGKVDNIDAIVYRDYVYKGQVLVPKERGYAQQKDRIVNTGKHTAEEISSTLFHEMGHHVEYGDLPGVTRYGALAREWRDERVTSMSEMSLREITGIEEYSENEVARPGSFFNPYLGKVYKGGSTEVIAMGMEHLDTPASMAALYDKQPDLFDFVIGITAHD
jgi:SPP1 gp7 family putative phage head morphogenesis protein